MRAAVFLIFLCTVLLLGQAFEVASVKPAMPGTRKMLKQAGKLRAHIDDAQVDLAGQSLAYLIQIAYKLTEDQVSGPDWLDDSRFDVRATLPAGSSKEQVPAMLQAMLADRFKLVVHHEPRTVAAYALTAGKAQAGLKSAKANQGKSGCFDAQGPPGYHICVSMTMAELAEYLTFTARMAQDSWGLDRPVFDATGLGGAWDFTMDYGTVAAAGGEPETLRIADAVKALGLKLEPAKHAFDRLVVDRVEHIPTEN